MNRMLLIAVIAGSLGLAGGAQAAGNAAAGKADSTTCAMCHGSQGQGTHIAPKLAGMQPAKFLEALEEFKEGKIHNAMMEAQAKKLSPQQEQDLAAYYASLK